MKRIHAPDHDLTASKRGGQKQGKKKSAAVTAAAKGTPPPAGGGSSSSSSSSNKEGAPPSAAAIPDGSNNNKGATPLQPAPSTAAATAGRDVSPTRAFFRAWAWKREHRPDRDRFHRPYVHALQPPGADGNGDGDNGGTAIVIKQCKFGPEGFASTVWDSSIVLARWLERWRARVAGRRVLDLSAGCGLVGIVAARLGARVVATDLAPNLPLLRANCEANAPGQIAVLEHRWGDGVGPLLAAAGDSGSGSRGGTAGDGSSSKGGAFFDLVLACDVMYVDEAVPALVQTLAALARAGGTGGSGSGGSGGGDNGGRGTEVLIAHGRNRGAEPAFLKAAAAAGLAVAAVPPSELDPVYQCSDVSVLVLALGG